MQDVLRGETPWHATREDDGGRRFISVDPLALSPLHTNGYFAVAWVEISRKVTCGGFPLLRAQRGHASDVPSRLHTRCIWLVRSTEPASGFIHPEPRWHRRASCPTDSTGELGRELGTRVDLFPDRRTVAMLVDVLHQVPSVTAVVPATARIVASISPFDTELHGDMSRA